MPYSCPMLPPSSIKIKAIDFFYFPSTVMQMRRSAVKMLLKLGIPSRASSSSFSLSLLLHPPTHEKENNATTYFQCHSSVDKWGKTPPLLFIVCLWWRVCNAVVSIIINRGTYGDGVVQQRFAKDHYVQDLVHVNLLEDGEHRDRVHGRDERGE